MKKQKSKPKSETKPIKQTVVSKVFENGHLLELVYAPRLEQTGLAHWDGKNFTIRSNYPISDNNIIYPVPPTNNLLRHGVIKLPSFAEDYDDTKTLVTALRAFIHRYVDLPKEFEILAAHYVLLSWVYDRFRELPYLRLLGDYGTGKTRFLLIVGSLCYKPIFASGASTTSPIFHTLDSFRGTLILDEADFRFSDAKSEMVKILNNGNVKGFPVLRCEGNSKGQYNPRAFTVFGPKIIATRSHYQDPALESRLITSVAKAGAIRTDIPINLPDCYEEQARHLRNMLLMFRFKNWHKIDPNATVDLPICDARISQIFRPLLVIAQDQEAEQAILHYALKNQSYLKTHRYHSPAERILTVMADLIGDDVTLTIKAITEAFRKQYRHEHTKTITPKWIGGIIRSKLHLATIKRNGLYMICPIERPKLEALFERYGVDTGQKTQNEASATP